MNVREATSTTKGSVQAGAAEDRLLVARAKSGCSQAFGELFERHHQKIYCTAFRVLRNRQDAEDAAQRSFQRAFTNLSGFREESTFSTWITRIAINEALMLLRQRRGINQPLDGNSDRAEERSDFGFPDGKPSPEEICAGNELRAVLFQAISKLRENSRMVVRLRELQGLSSAETARRLGITVAAVKARTFHARRHLRRYLKRKHQIAHAGFLIPPPSQSPCGTLHRTYYLAPR